MAELFLNVLDLGIRSGGLILAVLIIRLLLRNAPKAFSVCLWGFVGLRLVCPISIERNFAIFSGTALPATAEKIVPSESWNPISQLVYGGSPYDAIVHVAAWIWVLGIAVIVLYSAATWIHLHWNIREAVPFGNHVFLCDHIRTPFILGVLRPRIYLPSDLAPEDIPCVLAHENAHLYRKDHWWKPLGFLLLTVYWFHPLVWVGYLLLCRDIEFACDERVLSTSGTDLRKAYASALVHCSMSRRMVSACPLAFGECNVADRVRAILHYRKPSKRIVITAGMLCLTVAVGCLTVPVQSADVPDEMQQVLMEQIHEFYQTPHARWNAICTDLRVMDLRRTDDLCTVYAWVLYEEFDTYGSFDSDTAAYMPTVITVSLEDGTYRVEEYWTPRDGASYLPDILRKFPPSLWSDAMNPMKYYEELNLALGQQLKTALPEKIEEVDAYFKPLVEQERKRFEEEQKAFENIRQSEDNPPTP